MVQMNLSTIPVSSQPGGPATGNIPENFEVTVIDSYRGWRKIRYGNDQTAWIEAKYLND
jgi:uncharacterized protein YgiM (DUF1202 family)